jgi:hypothetical protein
MVDWGRIMASDAICVTIKYYFIFECREPKARKSSMRKPPYTPLTS